jgi:hypothetical protein
MDKSKFHNKKEWRKFGFGLSGILFIIASIQIFFGKSLYLYFYFTSLFILLVALTAPILIKPIFILFSYVGFGVGWFMTRLILVILFYLVFAPMRLIARLFGKGFLDLKFDRKPVSYWISKDPNSGRNYEKMF